LFFDAIPDAQPKLGLRCLKDRDPDPHAVVGLGHSLISALGVKIAGFREFPVLDGRGVSVLSTPCALWCWLRGEDRGELLHRSRQWVRDFSDVFTLGTVVDAFRFDGGRDLTGFEDGTENPTGERAAATALVTGGGAGLDGSSFVAVQRFLHDLDHFEAMQQAEQDGIIGRRKDTNQEIQDAPLSAHIRRTAQESFAPEAFVLRRSMPWAEGMSGGLVFVAFGRSLDAFEAQLRRMLGLDDGVTDGLFRFTRPVTGSYFWCPPMRGNRLDLSLLGA
jgi:putative iron-dependent peroxidase